MKDRTLIHRVLSFCFFYRKAHRFGGDVYKRQGVNQGAVQIKDLVKARVQDVAHIQNHEQHDNRRNAGERDVPVSYTHLNVPEAIAPFFAGRNAHFLVKFRKILLPDAASVILH